MLYLLYGADSFSRHEALAALRAKLDTDGMLATNTTEMDGRRIELSALTMVCDAIPFLAERRLVLVRGLLARLDGARGGRRPALRAKKQSAEDEGEGWLGLAAYVDRMPETTVLVLEDGDVKAANPLLGALRSKARVLDFPRLAQRGAIDAWIAERARRDGVTIDSAAIRLLAESAPAETAEDGQWHALWGLAGELEKLHLYAGGTRISEEDVRRLVLAALETRIYLLTDAVADRKGREALSLLEELLAAGRPAPVLLAAIAGRFRQLLLLRELLDARVPQGTIQEQLGIRNDFQFRRLKDQAGRLSLSRLEAAYHQIVDTDRAVKQGRGDESVSLELLVAELTAGAV